MGVIVGDRLRDLVLSISDCPEYRINYSDVDVAIDDTFWVEKELGIDFLRSDIHCEETDLFKTKFTDCYTLKPGEFIKARLKETFTIPHDIMGVFTLRSKVAQFGLEQSTSIFLKPDWSGQLILELKNQLQHVPIRLIRGSTIGQITFMECRGY
jgi:deoxycytidine triphosphate deaminase